MTIIDKIEKGVIISIIISIVLYFAMFKTSDLNEVKDKISDIGFLTIAILLLLTLANNTCRFIRWHLLLMNAKVKISLINSFKSFVSSLALTMTPGKSGELLKASIIRKYSKVSRLKIVPIVILERVFDLVGFALILLFSLIFSSFEEYNKQATAISILVVIIVSAAFILIKANKTKKLIVYLFNRVPFLNKKKQLLMDILDDYTKINTINIFTYIAISMAGWIFEVVEFYILLHSLGANVAFFETGFVFCFSSLAGSLILTPGGVGGFEGTSYLLLTNLLSIHPATAAVAILLIRATTIWFVVLIGIISYLSLIRQDF